MRAFKHPRYITRPLLPDLSEVSKKLEDVWESQWLTNNGPQHMILENELCKVLKVKNLSLFNNGTIALIVACQGLGISGEVITTPFTFAATPHVLSWNNLKPVFCDIDTASMNIDTTKIESMITPKTTGILAVHVFGTPCDVEAIQSIADRHGLKVIYDAAHAFKVEIDGKGIGSFGDITMFSFHATKLFHTAEGGALTYKDKGLKEQIEFLKNFGIKNEEKVMMSGINGKMNELQAVLGLVVLKYIDKEMEKRKLINDLYRQSLKDVEGISFLAEPPIINKSYQYLVIRIDEKLFGASRDYVYAELKKFNIFTRKYFYPLCSDFPCYKDLPSSNALSLPGAHEVAKQVLCLPFYGGLTVDDVENICDILKSFRRVKTT